MIIMFDTNWGPRYLEGETEYTILAYMLYERIHEEFYYYDEDLIAAQKALELGYADKFMDGRRHYEYEGYRVLTTEKIS